MLNELAKHDAKWRQIACKITSGNKFLADDIVNEMYLRRFDNDRGQAVNEYYIVLTMKSIYLNYKKTNKLICVEELRINEIENEVFECNDEENELIERFNQLPFNEKELLELSYDHSLNDIKQIYGIDRYHTFRTLKKARQTILKDRINEYSNKRLKFSKMKSIGFGDTIEKITMAIGLKGLIDKMNIDCGCDERKEYLNRIFAYKLKPRCMTPEELQSYSEFYYNRKFTISGSNAFGKMENTDIIYITQTFNAIFGVSRAIPECRNCGGTAKSLVDMVNKLDIVYANNIPKEEKKATNNIIFDEVTTIDKEVVSNIKQRRKRINK